MALRLVPTATDTAADAAPRPTVPLPAASDDTPSLVLGRDPCTGVRNLACSRQQGTPARSRPTP